MANMHCDNCLAQINDAATAVAGVTGVTGDPAGQTVTVTYRVGTAEPDGIREAIVERGFRIV
ncbi:MAG: heavy-metal-associated domain-containing protein [Gemmatimonadaceae bacterium]